MQGESILYHTASAPKMRKELQPFCDKKLRLQGEVERFGLKKAFRGGDLPTMLLKNVRLSADGNGITVDHLWVTVGKTIATLDPGEGDILAFNAWIRKYEKGYVNNRHWIDETEIDIGITRLSALEQVKRGSGRRFFAFWREVNADGKFVTPKLDAVISNDNEG
jgi:hypothetical protein